jgi:hypothetical protein
VFEGSDSSPTYGEVDEPGERIKTDKVFRIGYEVRMDLVLEDHVWKGEEWIKV